jgi:hypothetical protein
VANKGHLGGKLKFVAKYSVEPQICTDFLARLEHRNMDMASDKRNATSPHTTRASQTVARRLGGGGVRS